MCVSALSSYNPGQKPLPWVALHLVNVLERVTSAGRIISNVWKNVAVEANSVSVESDVKKKQKKTPTRNIWVLLCKAQCWIS